MGLEPIPTDIGQGRGAPWTSHQFIARLTYRDKQPFTLTVTPTGNLESPVNLTHTSLDCGKKTEYLEGTHMQTPHKNVLPQPGSERRKLLM